jgi:DNA polymerase-3 subunit epsilon
MDDPFDPQQPLNLTIFAVLDVETTGLSPAYGDRVCELACLRVQDGKELARFESLVDPARAISPAAYAVNGITPAMLAGAPAFPEIASPLLRTLTGAVLVGHNAPFDLGFLAAELDWAGQPPLKCPVVDTLSLVRRAYNLRSNRLSAVAEVLRLPCEPTHRAMSDVWTTFFLLEQLLADLETGWGVRTLEQLLAFQGGSIPYPLPDALPLPPVIAEALACGGRMRMRYVDARGRETDRVVRPLRVRARRGELYLIAHCFRRDALRTFRLDRVVELVLIDQSAPGSVSSTRP